MNGETIDLAKLIMINATTVALIVVASLSYWMGKRSVRVEHIRRSRTVDCTPRKDERTKNEAADGIVKRV